jgi:hypothetical protein
MSGKMRGFYEARTRGPDRRLYRLFCILEREAPGLDGPSVVVICGLSKVHGTAFSDADYESVMNRPRTFLTVARRLSSTRAAEELHLRRPGVSIHIRKLVAELQSPALA